MTRKASAPNAYAAGGQSFDAGAVAVLAVFMIGGYVDGWAHNHYGNKIESFFTIWHAVLYGGFALSALYFTIPAIRNRRAGSDWRHALPFGYATTLLGGVIFAIAGFCDMLWHIAFGIENGVDAFLSPPHLVLFFATILMFCGPIRAIVHRNAGDRRSWAVNGTFAAAMTVLFLQLTFMLQPWILPGNGDPSRAFSATGSYWSGAVTDLHQRTETGFDIGGLHADSAVAAAPAVAAEPTRFETGLQRLGVANVIIYAALVGALLLLALKAGRMPPGGFTLMFFIDTLGIALMRELQLAPGFMLPTIVLGLLWGILADVLYAALKPTDRASARLYSFIFLVPAGIVALYFIALGIAGGGTWWPAALAGGSVLYAGLVGLAIGLVGSRWEYASPAQ